MLNRFKNALYGSSSANDDSVIRPEYDYIPHREAVISKRLRSALTRSSSFRDELLTEISITKGNSSDKTGGNNNNNNNNNSKSVDKNQPSNKLKSNNSETIQRSDSTRHRSLVERKFSSIRSNSGGSKWPKYRYSRPEFLQLRTDDEISVSADHQIRPIILPRDVSRLPWRSGYAECINAGKSFRNEDQAACFQNIAMRQSSTAQTSSISSDVDFEDQIPWTYFGIFDGHAGAAVAVAAAAQLHNIISEKLDQISDLLLALEFEIDDENIENDGDEDFVDCANSLAATAAEGPASDQNDISTAKSEQVTSDAEIDSAESDNIITETDKKRPIQSENFNSTDEVGPQLDAKQQVVNELVNGGSETESMDKQSEDDEKEEEEERKEIKNMKDLKSQQVEASPNCDRANYSRFEGSPARQLPSMIDIWRNNVTVDSLISGALESAFWEMDALIAQDKQDFKMAGGCTAVVGIFILGKLYVCNAGDSRAIVYKNDRVIPMSNDFTPTSERERILRLGMQRPEFLGQDFTHLEFLRRPTRRDLGKQMLYRDAYMTGWSMKTITYDDLKLPLVWGEGKRSRVLATIGVTRGFGDHELRAQYGSVLIKPFLTPEPEVKILPLEMDVCLSPEDVLIMGSDGLWDVTSNEEAAEIVKTSFDLFPDNEESRAKYRYITAAQDLVIHSRGHTSNWNNIWRTSGDRLASLDDIAVFVIPLKQYKDEYLEWKRQRQAARRARLRQRVSSALDDDRHHDESSSMGGGTNCEQ